MENRDPMSLKEQEATRKLLANIEKALEASTSFTTARQVRILMKTHREDWPA